MQVISQANGNAACFRWSLSTNSRPIVSLCLKVNISETIKSVIILTTKYSNPSHGGDPLGRLAWLPVSERDDNEILVRHVWQGQAGGHLAALTLVSPGWSVSQPVISVRLTCSTDISIRSRHHQHYEGENLQSTVMFSSTSLSTGLTCDFSPDMVSTMACP